MTTTTQAPIEGRLFTADTVQLREVETTDSLSMMRGLAVPYGEPEDIGFFVEEFAPGSLGKSAKEAARALPLLLFHDDQAFPVGSTARWDEQAGGLYGEWKLDDHPEAQRAAKLAKDGHLTGLSIRFRPIRSAWTFADDPREGKDSVVRQEAGLLETSIVPIGAYRKAGVEWVRTAEGRPRPHPDEARRLLEWVAKRRG